MAIGTTRKWAAPCRNAKQGDNNREYSLHLPSGMVMPCSLWVLLAASLLSSAPLGRAQSTECMDFPDTTSFCFDRSGVIVVDETRDGQQINVSNSMSDSWMHLSRPDYTGHGLPHRSLLQGVYRSSSYLRETGARFVAGTTVIASFDHVPGHTYHFASSVLVSFLARIYYLEKNSTVEERHQRIVVENSGFDAAVLVTQSHTMNAWTRGFSDLVFSRNAQVFYLEDLEEPLAVAPVCFNRAVVLGKSIDLFSGSWDAMRFRELVTAQMRVEFKKEIVTICLRKGHRRLLNSEEIIEFVREESMGLEVVAVYFEDLSFAEQVALMARTAVFVSVHGAAFTNTIFLPAGAAVVEISPFRFNYNILERVAIRAGLLYVRYVASFEEMDYENSRIPEFAAFAKRMTNRQCNNIDPKCLGYAREIDITVDLERFRSYYEAALDVIE